MIAQDKIRFERDKSVRSCYLVSNNKKDCCGCGSCAVKCPKECISMVEDSEGFFYPEIKEQDCIGCGLCKKVCPQEEAKDLYIGRGYAAFSTNKTVLQKSSSGGIFCEIASYIIENGGAVYGAYLDSDSLDLTHVRVDKLEDLIKIQGSKYYQSDLRKTFLECRDDLENGRLVLFTGVPCQIEALKRFLGKEYEKLYLGDVICHGVPSKKIFSEYVSFLEKKHRAKLVDISFRDKKKNGWSITMRYTMRKHSKDKTYFLISKMSEYFTGFLSGYFMRESCYHCQFCNRGRAGDFSMGDFWGFQKTRPELANDEGLSLILINSEKGEQIKNILKNRRVAFHEVSEESIRKSENKNLYRPTARPNIRDTIYNECDRYGFDYIAQKYLRQNFTFKNRVKNLLPKRLVDRIKRFAAN